MMNKRIWFILLFVICIAVCLSGCDLVFNLGTGGSDVTDDHEHTGGTATCIKQAVCEICKESYGEKGEHDYVEATCTSPEVCTVCRNTRGTVVDHEYTDATCTEAQICENCGAEGDNALGHNWSNTYSYNSTSHWYKCTRCDAKKGEEAHAGGTATCDSKAKCNDCGVEYGALTNHSYTDPTCTEPAKCTLCGKEGNTAPHSYTDPTCTETAKCTTCGATGDAALGHAWNTTLSYNELEHWCQCKRCGEKKDIAEHSGGAPTETERAKCTACGQYYGEMPEIKIDWATEALAPANGGKVVLANKLISTWAEAYSYSTADTNSHIYHEDVFVPDVPILKWKVGAEANYFKVYVSKEADMSNAQCYITLAPELAVEHLEVGTEYYWYVDAVYGTHTVRSEKFTFTTEKTPRTVDIEGVSNARDIGGYITLDGKQIKQGMIYRSAKLDDITELGKYTLVNILGVKTDLDLRGDKATAPVSGLNHIATACPWYAHSDTGIFDSEANKTEFANTVKVFADINNYPIIFHCSLGRDRTGTLALVLEGLLGLDYNTLMMDYELSVFSYWGSYGATNYKTQMSSQIEATYNYIHDNYDGITFADEVENFLLDIGVTSEEIASIRAIMLEEV